MKLIRFLVPGSETFSLKTLTGKNVFSTFLAALMVSSVTLNTARDLFTPVAEAEDLAYSAVPAGLSRTRADFIKAIDLLSGAAATDRRLAGYYQDVSRRVKGERADGENISGIKVVSRVRTSRPSPPKTDSINLTAADSVREVVPAGIGEPAQSTVSGESVAESTDSTRTEVAQDSIDMPGAINPDAAPELTVGDMAFDTNSAIERWINYYGATPAGRRTMTIGITRGNAYLEMARAEFHRAGVPEDLVWLALVESVWNPRAVSPAAAGGIWQFIPSTATDYGLTVQSGNDERADPLKQTRVAAAYLHDLHTIFGDWALAMAAYNSGEPRVMSAIVKNGRPDFWELYDKQLLPKETCDYVPKILAAIRVASQVRAYDLMSQSETKGFAGS